MIKTLPNHTIFSLADLIKKKRRKLDTQSDSEQTRVFIFFLNALDQEEKTEVKYPR